MLPKIDLLPHQLFEVDSCAGFLHAFVQLRALGALHCTAQRAHHRGVHCLEAGTPRARLTGSGGYSDGSHSAPEAVPPEELHPRRFGGQ
ncbi:hypothetical protein ABZ725_42645 [Streptomyces sp. NPDC006872]|uniref:hypothetical protein n=1 Tax=Streptomyces sp. NPDC006872 TaxID=3155720 RepID=UPI0033D075C1